MHNLDSGNYCDKYLQELSKAEVDVLSGNFAWHRAKTDEERLAIKKEIKPILVHFPILLKWHPVLEKYES